MKPVFGHEPGSEPCRLNTWASEGGYQPLLQDRYRQYTGILHYFSSFCRKYYRQQYTNDPITNDVMGNSDIVVTTYYPG